RADGVIHTAFDHDFSKSHEERAAKDARAIEAMGSALAGSGRPLVIASGLLGLGQGRVSVRGTIAGPRCIDSTPHARSGSDSRRLPQAAAFMRSTTRECSRARSRTSSVVASACLS